MFILTDLSNMELKDKLADSSSLKVRTIPKDILLNNDTISLTKKHSTATDSYFESTLIRPILGISICLQSNNNILRIGMNFF